MISFHFSVIGYYSLVSDNIKPVTERKTGLEPATFTLATWRSTNWAIPANFNNLNHIKQPMLLILDQFQQLYVVWNFSVLPLRLELRTRGLKGPCSTNWAIEACFLFCYLTKFFPHYFSFLKFD